MRHVGLLLQKELVLIVVAELIRERRQRARSGGKKNGSANTLILIWIGFASRRVGGSGEQRAELEVLLLGIFISELGHRQGSSPVIWFEVGEGSEVSFCSMPRK